MFCCSRDGENTYLRGPIYAQASFFKEATYNMDLMRYDTLFFYYALTRIERRTMSQPRATYIKLLLIALSV